MADILTPRQRAVWGLMKKWVPYRDIAKKLGISTQSVGNHIVSVYDRMCMNPYERREMLEELLEEMNV